MLQITFSLYNKLFHCWNIFDEMEWKKADTKMNGEKQHCQRHLLNLFEKSNEIGNLFDLEEENN